MKPKIVNLPTTFDLSLLQNFTFGTPDGKDDPLLESCPLILSQISDFISENKSIVIGERGTGKTALVRLLKDGKLKFKSTEKISQKYVCIDEVLAYQTIREHVTTQVKGSLNNIEVSHRIVWELYLFSRCLESMSKKFKKNKSFNSIESNFYSTIGWKKENKMSLLDVLANTRKTIGVKLETGHLGYIIPNVYGSIEPSKSVENLQHNQYLDLPNLKRKLNNILSENNCIVYLLVDRLDEFVSGQDYDTQRNTIQALINCWREYETNSNIKLKLFLRSDLYERIDFSIIGRDKIDPKMVELKWTVQDIILLIASRVFHNLITNINRKNLKYRYDVESLTIDRDFLKEIKTLESNANPSIIGKIKHAILLYRNKLKNRKKDGYDERTISLYDDVRLAIVTLIFPRIVTHNGNEKIELTAYLSSHFQYASGYTTPRVILMLLQKCLEKARMYYDKNPDKTVELNNFGEYPLFLREHISGAYADVRKTCLKTILGLSREFERPAKMLLNSISQKKDNEIVSYEYAHEILGNAIESNDKDKFLKNFFAFYEHLGLFSCINRAEPEYLRRYKLPVLFRNVNLDN